jgi:RadC-like JAB domain-containing protein
LISVVFVPPVRALLVAPRNIVPRGAKGRGSRVTQLLRAPLPRTRTHGRMRFVKEQPCSLTGAEVKRAVPLLQNETQKNMNTTENLIQTEFASGPAQPVNEIVKPIRFTSQPQEWKIVSLRECATPLELQLCDQPDRAAEYWRAHVKQHPYFNPECECFVVLILNTRRRVKGHYLVSVGTLDTILVHAREVFRLAIMASASAIVIMHNSCAQAHKLCYVRNAVMCGAFV